LEVVFVFPSLSASSISQGGKIHPLDILQDKKKKMEEIENLITVKNLLILKNNNVSQF
jgi:hypothetical protein